MAYFKDKPKAIMTRYTLILSLLATYFTSN